MYREVALVLPEHLERAKAEYAKAAFSEVTVIPYGYGKFYLLHIYCGRINSLVAIRKILAESGVPFNAAAMEDSSKYSTLASFVSTCRYDHMGDIHQSFAAPKDELAEATKQLIQGYLWPDGAKGRLAELRALCISLADGWDNQAQYGRLYTMLQLLEAE